MFATFSGTMKFGHNTQAAPVLCYIPNNASSYPGSGTTINSLTPTNLTGTLSNVTYTSPALVFNGTSSYVSIADDARYEPGSGDFTVEAWVYHSTIGASRIIVAKTDNGGTGTAWSYGIRTTSTGSTYFEVGNGTASTATSPSLTLSTGKWYHVVGVWNVISTKTIGLYVNGVSQGTNSHTFTSIKNSSNPLYLGSYNGNEYAQALNGKLGLVRIYKSALSASDVQQAYNSSKYPYKPFTFAYTGADQIWTVPTGVSSITVTVNGASGGNVSSGTGGAGASITTTVTVTPGDTLRLVVGGKGGDGVLSGTTNITGPYGGGGYGGRGGGDASVYSGASGGGYSGIFKLNTISVANALVIAGGGGGASTWQANYGTGGTAGTSGNASDGSGLYSGTHVGGYGATTTGNGAAGTPYDSQTVSPAAGTQLAGGHGGETTVPSWSGAGGAGAGYYSGGGGAAGGGAVGAAGGGSSYIYSGSSTSYSTNTGNGSISITY